MINLLPANVPASIPYSQEAEAALLGSLLMSGDKFPIIAGFLQCSDFFLLRHQYIWKAMERISARHEGMDSLTLRHELESHGKLDDIGGITYIHELGNSVPTSMHAEVYGRIVQRAAIRRRMLAASDVIKSLAVNEELTTEHVRAEMARLVADINGVDLGEPRRGVLELTSEALDRVENRMSSPDTLLGIPTGFRDLDNILLGMQKTDLTIVGAVPGMGKTSWMLSAALNMARKGVRVAFVTQEMGDSQIMNRLLSLESGVNLQAVRSGDMTSSEYSRFMAACGNMAKLDKNLFIYPNTVTPEILRGQCMKWKMETGLDVVFVDYLQIMSSGGLYKPSQRVLEVGYFARSLKELARELRVPVIAAAQLNREIGNRSDKRPFLSDLRESGEIEQNADVVLFIHRDDYYNAASLQPRQASLIIGKHRNGPTGEITLYFEKMLTKFSNAVLRTGAVR